MADVVPIRGGSMEPVDEDAELLSLMQGLARLRTDLRLLGATDPRITLAFERHALRVDRILESIAGLEYEIDGFHRALELLAEGVPLAEAFPDGKPAPRVLTHRQTLYLAKLATPGAGRCMGLKKDGQPCSAIVTAGGKFCHHHRGQVNSPVRRLV